MGVGKTQIGKILSKELKWPYLDNDLEVARITGLSARELSEISVADLHEAENNYVRELFLRPAPFIAALPASMGDNEELLVLLKKEFTVYLHLPVFLLAARAGKRGIGRQALGVGIDEVVAKRYQRRDPAYRGAASLIVEISRSIRADAQLILSAVDAPL